MKNKRSFIVITAVIIALIVIIANVITNVEKKAKYETSKIEKRTVIESVEASGTINPVKTVSIGSQVSGMINAIYVDFNSKVKKGELLAQIDPSLFQAQVDKSQGDLNAAKANYQKTKSLPVDSGNPGLF